MQLYRYHSRRHLQRRVEELCCQYVFPERRIHAMRMRVPRAARRGVHQPAHRHSVRARLNIIPFERIRMRTCPSTNAYPSRHTGDPCGPSHGVNRFPTRGNGSVGHPSLYTKHIPEPGTFPAPRMFYSSKKNATLKQRFFLCRVPILDAKKCNTGRICGSKKPTCVPCAQVTKS